jgi:hypothetical protein
MHLFSPHECSRLHPSHSSWVDHPNNIYLGVKIIKLLITQSPPVHCYCVRLSPNIRSTPSEAEKHKHWYIKNRNIRSCDNIENTLRLMYDIVQFISVSQLCERVRLPNRVEMYKQPAPLRAVQVLPSSYWRRFRILVRAIPSLFLIHHITLAFIHIITSYITQVVSNDSNKRKRK